MRHRQTSWRCKWSINLCWFPASIGCNIGQCAKPLKIYEELGCKAVYGPKSCCAKRFECPDFQKLDDNKCTFSGKEYKIGEILPRNVTIDNTKCVETCFCTRSACIFLFLSSLLVWIINTSFLQTRQRARQILMHQQRLRRGELQSAVLHQHLWRFEWVLFNVDCLR